MYTMYMLLEPVKTYEHSSVACITGEQRATWTRPSLTPIYSRQGQRHSLLPTQPHCTLLLVIFRLNILLIFPRLFTLVSKQVFVCQHVVSLLIFIVHDTQ